MVEAPPPAAPIGKRRLEQRAGLLNAGTPVHGRWGSGKLIRTSLISILVLNNGRVLVGAVAPSVLYADAAHVK